MWAEEAEESGWDGDSGADGGDEVEGFGVCAGPLLCDSAAGDGAAEAGDYCDCAHDVGGGGLAAAVDALKEGGHPPGDAAEGEGDGGVAEDGAEVGWVFDEGEDGSLLYFCFLVLACAAGGLLHEDGDEDCEDCGGDGGDDERHAPAVVFTYGAADEVAEGCAYGDGYVEDGEDAIALVWLVIICEEGWGEDAEAGFAYA